jgi:hypothetical protein
MHFFRRFATMLQEAKRSKAHTADKCSQQEDFIVRPQEAAL